MKVLFCIGATVASIIVLFISTKIIGNKQMSQLNMFDYVNGITIGSIAAEMATQIDGDFWQPLLAIGIYTLAAVSISWITQRSVKLRRMLSGEAVILMKNGKLYKRNFKKGNLDMNEFLSQCRTSGYFNPNDLSAAILEQNGHISFMPKTKSRPATVGDLQLDIQSETICAAVILDGHMMPENIQAAGVDEKWVKDQLDKAGYPQSKDIYLAVTDGQTLWAFPQQPDRDVPKGDIYE